MKIVSDYEELFKIRLFSAKKNQEPLMMKAFECTYERLKNDLKNQYAENVDDKINRWIDVSRVQYFQDLVPVSFYIQAKMLYRDGFYEAAISVARSICEMICYEELSKQAHPFGDLTLADKHSPSFSVLKQFLLVPKKIEKTAFQKDIVSKIIDNNTSDKDSNFIKSSYELKSGESFYSLKTNNAKEEKNLIRFLRILKSVDYNNLEVFSDDVLPKLEFVWSHGSVYVHVKKSAQDAKTDALNILDNIGYVLYQLYGAEPQVGQSVTSAYSNFPDVCTGISYYMDAFVTPEAALSGYYNLPSREQEQRMMGICGDWIGEWGLEGNTIKGTLRFVKEGEYINCYLLVGNGDAVAMGISFFGSYFFINQINGDREIYHFELSFLNNDTLIGKHKHDFKYAVFTRQL